MEYLIDYKWRGMTCDVHISNCENLLDALYKFYDAHGMCEILKIEKVSE